MIFQKYPYVKYEKIFFHIEREMDTCVCNFTHSVYNFTQSVT